VVQNLHRLLVDELERIVRGIEREWGTSHDVTVKKLKQEKREKRETNFGCCRPIRNP